MKVLFLRSNPVDPDPRLEKEVLALCDEGFDISILAWDRRGSQNSSKFIPIGKYNVPILRAEIRSAFGSGLKNIKALLCFQIFLLKNLIAKRNHYDVIHAADFDTIIPAIIMKIFLKKKIVYDIYDFYVDAFSIPTIFRKTIKWIDYKAIKYVDAVIITNESRIFQIDGSIPRKLYIVHNTPEDTRLPQDTGRDGAYDIRFSYVGILQKSRLLDEILTIFSQHPKWKLDIAGFGMLEEKVRSISSRFKNISYHGKVSYLDGLRISNSSDVLFATYDPSIPNHKYASPNKLYEAMMLSKPIVVCNGTGIDDVVEEHGIGFAIDYNQDAFREAVEKFCEMTGEDYAEICRKSRKLYDDKYSWNKMKNILKEVYMDILPITST